MAASGTIRILLGVAIIVCPMIGYLLILAGLIDFLRVRSFERPIFAFEDDGSGTCVGFGYSFEIKEKCMPEEEAPEITEYTARIFHIPVMAGVRD